jgi:hypothetical protein
MLFCGVPPALSLTRCSKKIFGKFFPMYGVRNLNETRKIHPKVINLSKRNLTEGEIKLLKNGLKFTPTPNEDKTLLGADIDVFCRRLRINYIFNGNKED